MGLFKSTAVVSLFTLVSRISGFIRDMVMAGFFGVSIWTDAFIAVFRIPNFMRRLFAEGSFSMAFVPVLNEIKAKNSQAELKVFIDRISGTLLAIVLIVWMLMELFAPQIMWLTAHKWHSSRPDVFHESVGMLHITLVYFPLITLVAFAGGILNTHKKFAIPAATPILLNVSLIAAMFFLRDNFAIPEKSLALGVLIAGVLQLLMQIPALLRLGLFPRFSLGFKDKQVQKVMKLMVPTLFGSSVAQINILFDTIIALWLPLAVSATILYYSDRLMEFPLGIFAIAISTVILPTLSRQFAKDDAKGFVATMRWALNLGFFIGVPAAAGLAVLSSQVIATLFERGAFDASSTYLTSLSLMAYMVALPAYVLNKILLPAYYSRKDTKTPVKIGIIAMFSNMLFNLIFVWVLWYFEVVALHVGLALASAVSAWMQTFMLYRGLRSNAIVPQSVIQWSVVVKIVFASFCMVVVIAFVLSQIGLWSHMSSVWQVLALLACIGVGMAVYFMTLWFMKVDIKAIMAHR